jgi:hypothetical protein
MPDVFTPFPFESRPHVLLRSQHVCNTVYGNMYIPYAVSVSTPIVAKTTSINILRCTPIRGYWEVSAKQSCINIRATLVAVAGLNCASDILVYLWPAKPLWSLQLPLKRRLGLIFIFAVGLVVCVAGICRYVDLCYLCASCPDSDSVVQNILSRSVLRILRYPLYVPPPSGHIIDALCILTLLPHPCLSSYHIHLSIFNDN